MREQGSNWVKVVEAEKCGRDSSHKDNIGINHLSKGAFTHLSLKFMTCKLGMQCFHSFPDEILQILIGEPFL